jgi:hypothetical protein
MLSDSQARQLVTTELVDKSKFNFCSSSHSVIMVGNLRRPLKIRVSVSCDAQCRCTRHDTNNRAAQL